MHGMTSHGFPNLFFIGFTQAANAANITLMYDQQATHIAYMVNATLAQGATTLEPHKEAEDAWVRTIKELLVTNPRFWRECTPGYGNNEGSEEIRSPMGESYGPGFYAFGDLIETWRAKGNMDGMAVGT
jgi:cyclohexanone monooxygenase